MVVVFGSLGVDLNFAVRRLPVAGETVLCPAYTLCPGAKGGNQALAARRAGAEVTMVGAVGNDAWGTLAQSLLQEAKVGLRVAQVSAPTACASIYVDAAGENQIVVAVGANLGASHQLVSDAQLEACATVVVQMEVPPEQNWHLLKRARARGCRTVVNVAPVTAIPNHVWPCIDILVANAVEARQLAPPTPGDAAAVARSIAALGNCTCVVTLGAAGSLVASAGQVWRMGPLPLTAADVVDTTGAGDAFVGALAARLDNEVSLADAVSYATAAAGLACKRPGTQPSFADHAAVLRETARVPPRELMT